MLGQSGAYRREGMETPDERLAERDGGLLPPVNAARKVLRYFNSELVFSKDHGTFQVYEKMALGINGQIYMNPRILCGWPIFPTIYLS